MHTFKVSVPQEYDVAFIHNPDLSGDMEIVVTDMQRSGLRVKMAGSVLREFMEHIQECENDEDEPCTDPTTELVMLRKENVDMRETLTGYHQLMKDYLASQADLKLTKRENRSLKKAADEQAST
jgi:hypothetical protein